ncbi:UDP-N-acetylmuramoyl-L-alanine--D-glutamate ligase [Enemella evansiae]|uniref:UDP-N-acetylmuramoyl-L-alanine--D-glutamate ligase n=1 Tax=Enemella evansiae TaxID=2016499 RepID=UPI000B971B03|nr:UDP-N-acetylmuramoyl-L-alanine--D-glutamate ligase [Enemella evansiae]OYN95879.1 UDP-N-acetylmuramoyl-L-alanine--D-glutamate ligase [Enemella evansiae]OYO04088.1 UDP-N-acetylmuramoyl-L-alanine--D-glutamate ligase [Enemella evansiae]OYO13188.1 UDP-N-acetylmuramoyl-L-alanine--D-glutamate ligase [Enemella evansiae]
MGGRTVSDIGAPRPTLYAEAVRGRSVLVAGLGRSGMAAADGLLECDARVLVVDDSDTEANREKAQILRTLGAEVRLGAGSTAELPEGIELVVASPGLRPSTPLLAAAEAAGVPIWSEIELAWQVSAAPLPAPERTPWLAVTGTNGKTTTVEMCAAMLTAAGNRVALVGNVGRPVMEALLDTDVRYDVFVVELSSFQLHYSHSLQLHSAAVLNLAPDHLEWHASLEEYAADKASIYQRVTHSCVYNVDDPVTERMVEDADVTEGARAIGFTLGTPGMSMLGVVDDLLVDRAFIEQRKTSALELAEVGEVQPNAPHNIANALAAAALARSFGVPATAVRDGLRALELGGHRIQTVATGDGVTWVDDSKATNPAAAATSMLAFDPIVWIAGGQAKGTSFDELLPRVADRLRGAVLLGVDRELVRDALSRHAPDVPVIVIDNPETGAMTEAVAAAAELAGPGDTVLLAPGCASLDMFRSYGARGDAFADAVRAHLGDDPDRSTEDDEPDQH